MNIDPPLLEKQLHWAMRAVELLEMRDDPAALREARAEVTRLRTELGLIEVEPVITDEELTALEWSMPHGRIHYRDDVAWLIVDTADDIVAGGSDADILNLVHSILADRVLPVLENCGPEQERRARELLRSANWLSYGYSKLRSLQGLLGGRL